MKKQKSKNSSKIEEKVERKKNGDERKRKECKWYDWSTQRKLRRKVGKRDEQGRRTEIIEVRANCRCKEAKALHHLVMGEKTTSCLQWLRGKYSSRQMAREDNIKRTSPEEYFGTAENRL